MKYLILSKVHVQDVFWLRTFDCNMRQTISLLNKEFLLSQVRV